MFFFSAIKLSLPLSNLQFFLVLVGLLAGLVVFIALLWLLYCVVFERGNSALQTLTLTSDLNLSWLQIGSVIDAGVNTAHNCFVIYMYIDAIAIASVQTAGGGFARGAVQRWVLNLCNSVYSSHHWNHHPIRARDLLCIPFSQGMLYSDFSCLSI